MKNTLLALACGATLGFAGLVAADQILAPPPPPEIFPVLERFPNVELKTHDGQTVRFYEDLIKGKTVAITFMYITCKKF